MAKRLHNKEVEQAAARKKQEQDDLKRAQELQQQYDQKQENIDWNVVAEQMQEKHLDNIRKYQSLKRKPISVAQARKNMIVYLKNMAGYKMAHFRCMTYDQVRLIFEREYNKVQAFLEPDRDEEPIKKRVAKETLLQESLKKLRAEIKVSGSESKQETPTIDPKELSEEDVQNIEKNYPLTDAVMILMLSTKLQVDEDCEMARDLVMKIFMEANKPKSRRTGVDAAQRLQENALRDYCCWLKYQCCWFKLMLLGKNDDAAEVIKKLL
uniref:Uncharacterized protein n=1 Tax=Tanacetum cinerariifolium TaxID=118510 RepID=A0A699IDY1_TANCI|nr:hypothetical protein [Tanacetum cinerariifolium]